MADLDVKSDVVPVDEFKDPVPVKSEDYDRVREIQQRVEALGKYRQELGRLEQAKFNLVQYANEIETEMATMRRELVREYNLETIGTGQWAIDFEKKEFVKLSEKSPVIP